MYGLVPNFFIARLTLDQLYLIHWPIAFKRTSDDELSPLADNGKECAIDNSLSIVETWKGSLPCAPDIGM